MNIPRNIAPDIHIPATVASSCTQIENCVRRHPAGLLLLAAGLGVTAVLLARALTPPPPRNRAMGLLEDLQHHLASIAREGRQAVGKSADSLGDLHLDRTFGKLSRRFKNMFH